MSNQEEVSYGPSTSQGNYGLLTISVNGESIYTPNTAAISSELATKLSDTFKVNAKSNTLETTGDYVVSIANPNAKNTLLINATASGSIDDIEFGATALIGAYAGTLLNSVNLGASADIASLTDTAGTTSALNLDGGDGFDRLNGNASANTLTLTGVDSGTLDQINFKSIENIYLEGGDDTVLIQPGGRLSGILDGGDGTNKLQVDSSSEIIFNDDGSIIGEAQWWQF